MVRWLVEKRHLEVDVRAGVTGATPLMVVVTRCCVPAGVVDEAYSGGVCCRKPHALLHEPTLGPMPVLKPMAQLLVELGANPGAVDAVGNSVLAAAAAAGVDGMWAELMDPRQNILPRHPLDCCAPSQAGHILTAIVSAQDPRGVHPEAGSAALAIHSIRWLRQEYDARDWRKDWSEGINDLIAKQSASYGKPTPPEEFLTCAVVEAVTCARPASMRATLQLLLEVGCRLDHLVPGSATVDLPLVSWWVIFKHVTKHVASRVRERECSQWVPQLTIALAHSARTAPSAEQYAAAVRALQQRGATLKRPATYDIIGPDGIERHLATNPLLQSVAADTTHALLGVCRVSAPWQNPLFDYWQNGSAGRQNSRQSPFPSIYSIKKTGNGLASMRCSVAGVCRFLWKGVSRR